MNVSSKSLDWVKVLEVLKQNFKWMVSLILIVTSVALIYSATLPAIFTASALINPPKLSDAATNLGGVLGGGSLAAIGTDNSVNITIASLNTNRVKDLLIKKHDLIKRWQVENIQAARVRLAGMVSFVPDKFSGFLAINVDSTDPKLAAEIANGYVDALSQGISDVANNKTIQRYDFYREQMLLEQKELNKAESAVKAFNLSHGITAGQQSQVISGLVAQLNGQLVAAQANLSAMALYASPDNPDYKTLQATVASIKEQLNKINGQQSYGDDAVPTNLVPALSQEYVGLMRNQGIHEMVYKVLVNQFEGYKFDFLISQAPTPIQVMDKADVPLTKSKPNKFRIVFGSFLVTILLSLILVLLRNRKLLIKHGA